MNESLSLSESEAICRNAKNWKTSTTLLEKKCALKTSMAEITLLTFEGKTHSNVPVAGCKGHMSDTMIALSQDIPSINDCLNCFKCNLLTSFVKL